MNQIRDYLKSIIFFSIFLTFIGIIIPDDKYKKYISLILGLLLIFIILKPVNKFLNLKNFQSYKIFNGIKYENKTNKNFSKYENFQIDYIKKTFENQVKIFVDSLIKNKNFTLDSCLVILEEDFSEIKEINLVLNLESKKINKNILRVEKIDLRKKNTLENIDKNEIDNLKESISQFYNLSVDNIHIIIQKNKEGF